MHVRSGMVLELCWVGMTVLYVNRESLLTAFWSTVSRLKIRPAATWVPQEVLGAKTALCCFLHANVQWHVQAYGVDHNFETFHPRHIGYPPEHAWGKFWLCCVTWH